MSGARITLEYVPATDADKEYFHELNHCCYEDVVIRQFGSWDTELQRQNFEKKWPTNQFRKIVVDDEVVGGVWVDELPSHLQLREVQIHPDFQGLGYGTCAVRDVIDKAVAEGRILRLRVLHKNRALTLYQRLGFSTIEKTEVQFIMEYGHGNHSDQPSET